MAFSMEVQKIYFLIIGMQIAADINGLYMKCFGACQLVTEELFYEGLVLFS
jgi:hypothetical protein